MRMHETTYRLILDSLSEGVCAVDREWRVTTFNRAAQELTGVSAEEALGISFGELFHCEICECSALLSGVMETGKPIAEVATRIASRGGERIPISVNASPIRNDAGEMVGLVATFRDNRPLEVLRKELSHEYQFDDIISKNDRMRRIFDILPDVAESGSTVLILGPSGTGKELLARAVHHASPRHARPFVAVNCGALPDNLLESELFGYRKGAFTDAKQDKPGRFARAEGGTLFLDEIGDISPAMQVKLLRVLQEKTYEPLGATAPETADVRIVAATNKDLLSLVEAGTFRADLYYRLNVIQFDLPPLAERPEDIPLLIEHFIRKLNAEKGRGIKQISKNAMARLIRYDYPGNIRELQNIIERAYIVCRFDEIQEQCLPPRVLGEQHHPEPAAGSTPRIVSLRHLSDDEERRLIESTLRDCNGNRKQTAARLSIHPSTLWRKMKRYAID